MLSFINALGVVSRMKVGNHGGIVGGFIIGLGFIPGAIGRGRGGGIGNPIPAYLDISVIPKLIFDITSVVISRIVTITFIMLSNKMRIQSYKAKYRCYFHS